MYDIRQLEDNWKKYNKKKRKPWYIGSLVVFIIVLLLLLFSNNVKVDFDRITNYFNTFRTSISSEIDTKEILKKNNTIDWLVDGPLMTIEIEKEVIDEIEPKEEQAANILVDIPILDGAEEIQTQSSKKSRKKMHLNIIKTANITAYKDVERRFKQSHEIDDSLFLARSYYKKGNYKKSEYWALETNKVDSNIEESILIFVKSKMKLGRENEAINILTRYIKKSHSHKAKKLLYKIENGKF